MFLVGRKQSYTETALVVNMSPKTVERVVLAQSEATVDLAARYAQVRRLGIDELSHRKGKGDYICVLTDLERGTVVDILPDRKKATLLAHFQELGADFCAQITHVSCDLWDAYLGVAQQCFPQAQVVLDRFHVTKMLNEGLDEYRKSLRRKEPKVESYRRLKHMLGKQYHTLSDASLDYLAQAFESDGGKSGGLHQRYFLREDFHHILDNESTVADAAKALTKWIAKVEAAKLPEFDRFINMAKKYSIYILNYVIDQVSNAVTEGLNNLIRSIKRIAWGMPSFVHLRVRVLACSQ
jgi:transposase